MSLKEQVLQGVDEKKDRILEVYHFLYEHPEISLQEFESSKKLAQVLREEGFEVEEHLEGMETAFRAVKKNGKGPKIALIAEYDALPGNGHACGHHMIASMSVGAALGLSKALESLNGEVAVIGTPGEETGHGKPYLVEHGVFDHYDMAMMIHPNSETNVFIEMIAIGGIDFTFIGKPAHAGAEPYKGVNALDAVVLFYNNLSVLRQQLRDGTRIHGIILEAGSAANIIPDRGKIRLEFRAKEQDYFDEVIAKAINCAKAAALATGCELEYEHFEPTCMGLKHNKVLANCFIQHMEEMGVYEPEEKSDMNSGSTDLGNVSQRIPTIHPMLKVSEGQESIHSQEFKEATLLPYAQDAMIKGAKMLALTGLDVLENPALLEKAWAELKG